jgi:hypothetical protein
MSNFANEEAARLVDEAAQWSATGNELTRINLLRELNGICRSDRQAFNDVANALQNQYTVDVTRDASGTIKEIIFNTPDGKHLNAPGCIKPHDFDVKKEEAVVVDLVNKWSQGSSTAKDSLIKELCRLSPAQLKSTIGELSKDYNASAERNGNEEIIGINIPLNNGNNIYIPLNVCEKSNNGPPPAYKPEKHNHRAP